MYCRFAPDVRAVEFLCHCFVAGLNIYCLSYNVAAARYTSCHPASCVITLILWRDIRSAADIYIDGAFAENTLSGSSYPFSVFPLSSINRNTFWQRTWNNYNCLLIKILIIFKIFVCRQIPILIACIISRVYYLVNRNSLENRKEACDVHLTVVIAHRDKNRIMITRCTAIRKFDACLLLRQGSITNWVNYLCLLSYILSREAAILSTATLSKR